jgi:hypothetical protein
MPVDTPDIEHTSQATKLTAKMKIKTIIRELPKKEKRLTHCTATMKILAQAFGTWHCRTSSPQT